MSIFKTYDIRGIYGDNLTEKDAYLLGFYLPRYLKLDEIKLAHDLRLSYETLTKFFVQGLIDANCKVFYLGESSTPNFYYSLFKEIDSGVMITASHNGKEYNGFKIISKLQSFDSRNGLYELEKLIKKDQENKLGEYEEIKDSIKAMDLKEFLKFHEIKLQSSRSNYVDFLKDFYTRTLTGEERNTIKKIPFSLDFSSGVSSLAVIPFIKEINLNCTFLNEIPDGDFPNHSPDPSKAKEFLANIEEKDSIFTAVFDGDGDRIAFYDENKKFVFPDYMIATLMDYFISINSSSQHFVVDLRASRYLNELAQEKNAKLELLRVGRAFYQDYMNEHSCIYGAELSGHMFFRDFKNFDNPDIALIYILKIVAQNIINQNNDKICVQNEVKNQNKFHFSKMIDKYKKYYKIEETNLKVNDADDVFKQLENKYENNLVLEIDGLSFDFKDYWFNIRKSNTEPVVRINFEGKEKISTKSEFDKLITLINSI